MPALDGCNRLPFDSQIRVSPDLEAASNPSALGGALGTPGDQVGYQGAAELKDIPGLDTQLFPGGFGSTQPLEPRVDFCPNASKVATVTIHSPLLPDPVEGAVYLAAQNANPFGSLIASYIIAEDPLSGVLIKLAGAISFNSETGQIVTTFSNSPQTPFEDAELHFFGGERAPLATPAHCGAYTTTASFTPWSSSEPVNTSSSFNITSGPNGSPCPRSSLPFSPYLTGGTTNINAGSFTALTTTVSREDGQQDIQSVQLHLPPGLSGTLAHIPLCPEAQANEGTCPSASLIGETTVTVGLGADPYTVKGGKVYITEGYEGAPFGLSIVNPAKAGPFDLEDTAKQHPACDCVVVRAKIAVNPITAALTVTTDSSGPYAIPTIIEGIPLQIKHVNVLINRPDFTFNPTSCDPLAITANITSTTQTNVPLTIPFQVTNCAILKFAPAFSVSTGAHTSKAMSSQPRPDRSSLSEW